MIGGIRSRNSTKTFDDVSGWQLTLMMAQVLVERYEFRKVISQSDEHAGNRRTTPARSRSSRPLRHGCDHA